eukprot:TRINITY_DN60650_c0_g1_i1.p1 TRINITY_DN60650_c0_g1~~TRINITY_DN60650_c0_g1_i1.p1  ORF type:complete len:305 (+),score=64.61 TRINITY_DN60650_c0_g1_i1:158-1072(+)
MCIRDSRGTGKLRRFSSAVSFPPFAPAASWVAEQVEPLTGVFESQGYVVLENIIPGEALGVYQEAYNKLHSGEIDSSQWRHDLGSHKPEEQDGVENTGQIMWPSDRVPGLAEGPFHSRSLGAARTLFGSADMAFDFDMLIYKDGNTFTETPWHQDAAYWPSGMSDTRACSCWVALDDVHVANGCLWMVPGSHKEAHLRQHRPATPGSHILMTDDASEQDGKPVELKAGSAVLWHGRTLHYARGNTTSKLRRAYITNYRPGAMVEWERANGFDHLRGGVDQYDPSTGGDAYQQDPEQIKLRTKPG